MIQQPTRDEHGNVVPHDHAEVTGGSEVIRRISKEHIVEKGGRRVVSSMAYKASTGKNGGMSVDLKQLIEQDDCDPIAWVTTPRWIGSVCFKVSSLRTMDFMVGYAPIQLPEPNPYHGEVWGEFSRARIKRLKNMATWFVVIDDVDLG